MAKKKSDWRAELAQVVEQLRDPFRMRMAVAGVTLLVMFFAISEPIQGRLKQSKRALELVKTKARTAEEVVLLQSHLEKVEPRVLRGKSDDVVAAHLVDLIRQHSVDLMRIDTESPKRMGPMDSIRVSFDVTGTFEALSQLISSIERNEYLMRVESVAISPAERNRKTPAMQLSLRVLRDPS